MAENGNADQIAYWNADAGEVWAVLQQHLDAQLEPHGLKAIEALAPRAGERHGGRGLRSRSDEFGLGASHREQRDHSRMRYFAAVARYGPPARC